MITFVRGTVVSVASTHIVLDVGAVGMMVRCTPSALANLRVGDTTQIPASLVVREDSLTLYGFASSDERELFDILQTASGVGPKLAQAMLAVLAPDDLRYAVATEDYAVLTKVPGVGKKGAQRIVIELKDKLIASAVEVSNGHHPVTTEPWREQVHQALVGLGWSAAEADRAVKEVSPQAESNPDITELLRTALRTLAAS